MSDDSYTWACPDLVGDAARSALDGLRADLVERGIIEDRLTDCILSDQPGYPPGPRASDALQAPSRHLLEQAVNGLELVVGREVAAPYGDDYEGTTWTCGSCNARHDFDDTDAIDGVGAWFEGGAVPVVRCPACGHRSAFEDLDLEPAWCLAEAVVRVWNWYLPQPWFIDLVSSHLTPRTITFYNHV